MSATSALKLGSAAAMAGFAYARVIHPMYAYWGATDAEIDRPMPLDDRVPSPCMVSTRAITILAPPEDTWPWIVQMGEPPRAGYYSFTTIERLVGLQVENEDVILPEFQTLTVGDALDKAGTMRVLAVEPEHYLVLGPPDSVKEVQCTWAFCLYPLNPHTTRLVTRVRADWSYLRMLRTTSPLTWPFYLLVEPGAFVMEWKMFHGIRTRAEALTKRRRLEPRPVPTTPFTSVSA